MNTIKDDGFTGTNFQRPAFQRMMEDARNGKVNTIVVKDLSRFGREHLQVGNYLQVVLPEMRIRFIAIGDDVDSAKGSLDYDLMVPIKNIFNEYYPADCSRKTRQALKTKAENGEFIAARAPYGYRKSKDDKHILEIDEQTAPIVREIFELAAYHSYGYDKIARELRSRKVLTPSAYTAQSEGKSYTKDPYDWNLTSVYNMLNNRTYLGHCVNGKRTVLSFKNKRVVRKAEDEWIVVENVFPPLITEQLWNDTHERLKTRKHESTTGFVNLFAGLLKCDHCGKGLGLSNTKDHSNYYVCNTYKKKGPAKCTSHYLPYDDLYGLVLTEVQRALLAVKANREAFIQSVQAKLNAGDETRKKALEKERDELAARVADLSKKYRQLYDDRYKGILSDRMFMELSAECEAEGNLIRNVYASDKWGAGEGIILDNSCSGITVQNNIAVNANAGGWGCNFDCFGNVIRNNIFAYGATYQLTRYGDLPNTLNPPPNGEVFSQNIVIYESGPLFKEKEWASFRTFWDYNLYWREGGEVRFMGGSFEDWKEKGLDVHSVIADPRFADPKHGDFSLPPDSPALAIGFEPFSLDDAGILPEEQDS